MKYILNFFLVVLFVTSMSAFSNETLKEIDEIRVEGNRKVEKEAILQKITTRVGGLVDSRIIANDVEQIYGLKFFDQVEVHQKTENNKNILVYLVQERAIIKKVIFEGNKEISKDDLQEKVKTKDFSILDINTIQNDVNALQKHYEEKGFFLAAVSYTLKPIDKENTELIFKIREFDKVKVKKISFLGNRALSDSELKDVMETREESVISFMTGSGGFKEQNFKTDIERLKYFYKTKGYLQVNIGSPDITVSEDKRWLFVTMKVNEGPQFTVNELYFEGEMLFTPSELMEQMQLKKDETYSEELLRFDIQKLTEMYQDKGYAFANVNRTLKPVPGENKVDVVFSFEKGRLAYIGTITVKGNSKTRDKVVRRELTIKEGMLYNGTAMRVSKENVARLGYFEPNNVIFNTIAREGHEDILDIDVAIKEKDTGQLMFGAGYSTASKGFIQASVSKMNFLGLGQELNLTVHYASQNQEYSLGFTEPYLLDTKWTAGGRVNHSLDESSWRFKERRTGFDYRMGYPIFDYTRLFVVYSLSYTELYDVNTKSIDTSLENGYTSAVETFVERDKRNNRWDATGGYYSKFSVQYAGLGGDRKWTSSALDGRYYNNFYGDFVFRTRLVAAKIFEVDADHRIPTTNKFFLGGPKDLRGYTWEGIGPKKKIFDTYKDAQGNEQQQLVTINERGLFKAFTNIEIEHPIIKEGGLKWVVFFDAGNVYRNFMGDHGDYSLKADWGFGIRFFSPIGPLRFEFGYPLNREDGEKGNMFQFDIGQSF